MIPKNLQDLRREFESPGMTYRMMPLVRVNDEATREQMLAHARLLKQAGFDLAALRTQAESRNFRPVPTGITLDVSFTNSVSHLESANVVGLVRGSHPKRRNEYVVMSAHWDHLGIGPKVNGDSIYNGAVDNASGVANLLAIATSWAETIGATRNTNVVVRPYTAPLCSSFQMSK